MDRKIEKQKNAKIAKMHNSHLLSAKGHLKTSIQYWESPGWKRVPSVMGIMPTQLWFRYSRLTAYTNILDKKQNKTTTNYQKKTTKRKTGNYNICVCLSWPCTQIKQSKGKVYTCSLMSISFTNITDCYIYASSSIHRNHNKTNQTAGLLFN